MPTAVAVKAVGSAGVRGVKVSHTSVVLLVMVKAPPPPAEPKVPLVFTVPAPEPVMAAPPAMIFQV